MEHVEYAYTTGMDDADIEDRLRQSQTGVLSLSNDNDAYAIPLAHYYDGDNLYFRLGITDGSEKGESLQTTEMACYVLYDTEPTEDPSSLESWSVIITGRLSELSEAESDQFDTAAINRVFTPIRVFDEPIEDIDVVIYKLEIDTLTGRETPTR